MRERLLLFATIFCGLSACVEKIDCEAELCVKNVGNDTIRYAWNSTSLDEKLEPQGTTCRQLGRLQKDRINDGYFITQFNSDRGTYAIKVEQCYTEYEIE